MESQIELYKSQRNNKDRSPDKLSRSLERISSNNNRHSIHISNTNTSFLKKTSVAINQNNS